MSLSLIHPGKLTARIVSMVLVIEIFIVLFATLVVYGLGPIPQHVTLIGGGVFALLIVIAIGMVRTAAGLVLAWIVQLLLVASGFLQPTMFLVGGIFAGLFSFGVLRAQRLSADPQTGGGSENGTDSGAAAGSGIHEVNDSVNDVSNDTPKET